MFCFSFSCKNWSSVGSKATNQSYFIFMHRSGYTGESQSDRVNTLARKQSSFNLYSTFPLRPPTTASTNRLFHISNENKWNLLPEPTITYSILFIPTLARVLTDSYRTFIDIVFSPLNKKTNNISQVLCAQNTNRVLSWQRKNKNEREKKDTSKRTTHRIRGAPIQHHNLQNVIV